MGMARAVRNNNFYGNASGKYSPDLSSVSIMEQTLDPQFTDAANGDYSVGANLDGLGFPDAIGVGAETTSFVSIGVAQRTPGGAADYPAETDVRDGVDYDTGAKTGTCKVPVPGDVRDGVDVDATTGTCKVPAPADVRDGVDVDVADTGVLDLPAEADVKDGVVFDNTTKTGTYDPMAAAVFPAEANTLVAETAYGPTGAEYAGEFDESARNKDPGESNVRNATGYKILNVAKTGTMSVGGSGGGGSNRDPGRSRART
jgi:hypothetical protein